MALRRRQPWRSGNRRTSGKVAVDVIGCVTRFDRELTASETDPKRSMGIGAGQGWASRGRGAPARLPPDEDGQGPRFLHRVPRPALSGDHAPECSSGATLVRPVICLQPSFQAAAPLCVNMIHSSCAAVIGCGSCAAQWCIAFR